MDSEVMVNFLSSRNFENNANEQSMYQNGGGDTLNPMGGTEQSTGRDEMGSLQFGTLE